MPRLQKLTAHFRRCSKQTKHQKKIKKKKKETKIKLGFSVALNRSLHWQETEDNLQLLCPFKKTILNTSTMVFLGFWLSYKFLLSKGVCLTEVKKKKSFAKASRRITKLLNVSSTAELVLDHKRWFSIADATQSVLAEVSSGLLLPGRSSFGSFTAAWTLAFCS